jgi:hypothetical protein
VCTASWIHVGGRFELFFNRDEQRTRAAALPPRVVERDGVRAVMPLDGQDHGTWIAANEFGLVVCLLNLYEVAYVPRTPTSRGRIVADLARARSLAEARAVLADQPLVDMRAFTVAVFEPRADALDTAVVSWDGEALREHAAPLAPPLVSSGFDLPRVRAARLAAWRELVERRGGPNADLLDAYHASKWPEPGPLAVAMERTDACTVSHSRVTVDAERVELRYSPGVPPATVPAAHVHLLRRSARGA